MEGSKEIILYILLFFVISMPFTYNVTNKLLNTLDKKGCPTYLGIFLHTIIFGVLIYVINKLEFIKEDFQVLKQVAPKVCDIKKGNQDCPNNYLCVENYDFCQGTKKIHHLYVKVMKQDVLKNVMIHLKHLILVGE